MIRQVTFGFLISMMTSCIIQELQTSKDSLVFWPTLYCILAGLVHFLFDVGRWEQVLMSATWVGVAPSGECLQSICRYGSHGWQVKLCDPLVIGPISERFRDEVS